MNSPGLWLRLAAAALALAAAPVPLPAWSNLVHRVVARIAQERLSPTADRRQRLMMGSDAKLSMSPAGRTRSRPSARKPRPGSSITIPPTATRLDLDRDCPVGDCTPVKLRETVGIVRLAHKDKPQLIEAFKFLINLAVDLHQPLRAGYPPGNGGDPIPVVVDGHESELFTYWDQEIFANDDEDALVARIRELITPARARAVVRRQHEGLDVGNPPVRGARRLRRSAQGLAQTARRRLRRPGAHHSRAQLAKAAVRLDALLDQVWPSQ